MDDLEKETLALIEKQMKRKVEVDALVERHRSAGVSALTRLQLKSKIQSLEKILGEYKTAHEQILIKGKIDIPYLVNKNGEKMINQIEQYIEEIQISKSFDGQSTANGSNQGEINAIDRKIKILGIKISKLNYAIEDIYANFTNGTQWNQNLFDVKQRFLQNMWQGISALEEEIELETSISELTTFNPDICRDAIRNLDAVIIEMTNKISSSNVQSRQSNSSTYESRLPEIKIPVFNGDFKKWNGFKEIFESLIHCKPKLSPIQKMEYLKSHLEGEPSKVISSYLLSGKNYEDAWEALNQRYNNKRRLLTLHLDSMKKPFGKDVTSKNVKKLYDNISEGMNAIKNLGIDNSSWGPIVVHNVIENLDRDNRALFEEKFNENPNDIPDLKMFLNFLESRFKSLEVMESIKSIDKPKKSEESKIFHAKESSSVIVASRTGCPKCTEEHKLVMCPKFLSLTPNARFKFVKVSRLCFKCLQKHGKDGCQYEVKACTKCQSKRHNSLIHLDRFNVPAVTNQINVVNNEEEIDVGRTLAAISSDEEKQEVLATAKVHVKDVFGNDIPIRILIDTGAQKNYITEGMAQKLQLTREDCRTNVTGIGTIEAFKVKSAVTVTIHPHFESDFEKDVKALVMGKKLTSMIPDRKIEETLPRGWRELALADPSFNNPGEIDMVVGIGFFVNILVPGMQKGVNSNLMALNSKIGWIVFGESKGEPKGKYRNVQSMISLDDIQDDLIKFWELEEIHTEKPLSEEDSFCEQHYASTYERLAGGRYMVKIPFKEELKSTTVFGSSRKKALLRFYNLESKFRSNPELAADYKKFVHEYIDLGHMQKVYDDQEDSDVYFMPHHCVIRPESTTTKLRVVFDASAKTVNNNLSLNEVMIAGPRLQDDITSILLRWRFHKFVVTADIEKMYRQILIAPEHRKYQRIFWRDSQAEKMSVYELSTVTYGTTSAPYLAIKTLQQLAKDDFNLYPEAAKSVLEDFYVDDLLTGRDTIEQCMQLQKDVRALLKRSGMNLRKWSSNSKEILEDIEQNDISEQMMNFGTADRNSMKALGLNWNPTKDSFTFKCNNRQIKNIIIEGNIGCGKSSLLESLKVKDNIEVFPEPIGKWADFKGVNLLQKFYDQPNQWAYKFQDYVITTLVENHLQTSTAKIKVVERSVFAAKDVFLKSLRTNSYISEDEFKKLYKRCQNLIKIHGISADLIIYLRTDPETSLSRVQSRGRKEESNLTLKIIEDLHDIHEEYLRNINIPVVIIDANQSSQTVLRKCLVALSDELSNPKVTKRTLCSDISKIFDPLGWLAPVTIVGKMLFQQTWKEKIDWNDQLTGVIQKKWIQFRNDLSKVSEIETPRWINTTCSSYLEIHGFCDASQKAYAAAVYVKVKTSEGVTSTQLLMAKTKVAPVKQELTVAKLELCGALLLAKLYQFIVKTFKWEHKKFIAWCDSQITIAWIKGEASRWKIFVANRISQIQQLTRKTDWRYIPTNQNCADVATRGVTLQELKDHKLWWFGPEWLLCSENNWPDFGYQSVPDMANLRKKNTLLLVAPVSDDGNIESIIKRFSSFTRLKIVLSYCFRFVNNCKSKMKVFGVPTVDEINYAERCILKQVQQLYYTEDIENIQQGIKINNRNGILALAPMLDDFGVLRVRGRLQNSFLSYDEKHPVILPRTSILSRLIVRHAHWSCKHGTETLTEYVLRRRFWIVKGKSLIKTIQFHCIICKKYAPKLSNTQMGQLPPIRLQINNAFFNTGVDYAGPFELKAWKGRCNKKYKSYVAVFVCMVTKAVHLELVTDLGSECFIAAYRRFSSRRGPCKNMHSDCGTNFVGANKILQSEFSAFQAMWKEELKELLVEGLQWHFNPPAAPHMGGMWEAAVKSMKNLLHKFLSNTLLTFEEFYTILVQVEGCLNARPLGSLKSVPEDRVILTPSHFLTGTNLFSNPEPEVGKVSIGTRWKYIQKLKEELCTEFKIQIIQNLQPRTKWKLENLNLKVGDLVVVEDNTLFSRKWPMGLVHEVHPGSDGIVRVVTLKMDNNKLMKRAITKLGILPILEE